MVEPLKLQCVTPPVITPFLLQEAKDHLRVTGNDDDHYIQQLVIGMNEIAGHFTNRALFTSTWRFYKDTLSYGEDILLPRNPVQSILSLKYYDTGGELVTLNPSFYQVDLISEPARLRPAPNLPWPTVQSRRLNAVQVEFVAGYATRGQLPASLRNAMFQHISHLYDRREPVVLGSAIATTPLHIFQNYDMVRVNRFF